MSAQIIPLNRAENVEFAAPLRPHPQPLFRAALTSAARRYWRRTRLMVEGLGWIIVAASIIAGMR